MPLETITGSAIMHEGIMYSVPAPGRHHDVIRMMHEKHGLRNTDMRLQGFVTSTGRFVTREEAVPIATAAGQIIKKTCPAFQLFSEDVW